MVTTNLEKIFTPKSIAVIGASDKPDSVGYALIKNLTETGYDGKVYPVNIQKNQILGLKAYQTVDQLPETVDLAVIATPAKTVPDIVEQCGKAGISGVVIVSAGFKETGPEGKELETKIAQAKTKYNMRIVGPNALGVIRPSLNLNATFTNKMPKQGNIAFISQSGALGSAILDWANHENIGFSNFVSVGSMIDVDFGDLIDYFGTDPKTRSILMYMESLTNARKFMSAARHFARTKPIIVVKAGKYDQTTKAVAAHTGEQAGEDIAYDAAFKRVGMVRVEEIGDLFNCAEVLGVQPLPAGPKLAIITNAGGAGVMAADALISGGGKLAKLAPETVEKLNKVLPKHWSQSNPVDVLGDAKTDRYETAITACLDDKNVDGLLIVYAPLGLSDPLEVAESVSKICKKRAFGKPILTSFMGYEEVEQANRVLNENSIPTYATPEQAIKTYLYMNQYKRNLELLYQTPEELPVDSSPPKRPISVVIREAARQNRENLTEIESKQILENYKIPVIETLTAETEDEAVFVASRIGYPLVLKVLSPQIVNASEVKGVVFDIKSDAELKESFREVMARTKELKPDAQIFGVTLQRMIKKSGYLMMLGAKTDSLFGPLILFGMNDEVDVFHDIAVGIPPLNQALARRIIEETGGYMVLKGYRNLPPANLKLIEEIMVRFSQLLVDFPQIKQVDINPLFINEKEALAHNAKIVIDKEHASKRFEPHEHLVISPYPKKYETSWKMRDGRSVLLRPIKPEDEPMWLEMFQNFSEQSIRYRFFQIIKDTPHEVRVRYSNIDYDREIGIVAELKEEQRKILGVVRLIIEPDGKTGEIAFIVADPWQGLGLGTKMVDHMIEICKDKKLDSVYAYMLPDNRRAIQLLKKMGFTIEHTPDVTKATLNLKE
ncbi:MAG: GNAT family N-acetyltransferase [Candidatus Bathyarchaeota archaeon]|nr:GNAT family N-acetyltransferase [Candidatus Bathyarchaeota archaeon]